MTERVRGAGGTIDLDSRPAAAAASPFASRSRKRRPTGRLPPVNRMATQRRILMADDHALVRAGIRALLESLPGIEVVGETGDGLEAVELVRRSSRRDPARRDPAGLNDSRRPRASRGSTCRPASS